ncbi:MAG: patatin-like phospholipase family protein [Legionella sp.]
MADQKKADKKKQAEPQYKYIACTFQGGGALGAYQAGVLRALDEAGYNPNWFVGTSIGAINAAIAAGNPEKLRVEKMYEFWQSIATPNLFPNAFPETLLSRQMEHMVSSQTSLMFGQPGFFTPRFPSPEFTLKNTADSISYYDTSPLRATLERFVDFDRINTKEITRLSVGAVEICSGEMVYFDSHKQTIGPEHIMASGALPPGFPAVEVEGKLYWDGGVANNSPIGYVLNNQDQPHMLCFMVNLFDSYGLNPTTLDEIYKRRKDIEFSSKFAKLIQLYQQVQGLKNSIHILSRFVPPERRNDPELRLCMAQGHNFTVSLVHFLCELDESELSSKDYEFSEKTIMERIACGYRDGKKAVKKSPWSEPVPLTEGIALHEMSSTKYLKRKNNE